MKIFKTFESVDGMLECIKKPIVIHAQRQDEEFQVVTLDGNHKTGKAGDYLMQGIDNRLYICDKSIFERSYDWVPPNSSRGFADAYDRFFSAEELI